MNEEDVKSQFKRNNVIISIISIATLVIVSVGTTLAYFTATILNGDMGSSIVIKSASLNIIYREGDTINVQDVEPGWVGVKHISIENPTQYFAVYTLRWKKGVFNNFNPREELVYRISCNGQGAPEGFPDTVAPGSDPETTEPIDIFASRIIPAKSTHYCEVRFEFLEASNIQNYNQDKLFYGTLELVVSDMSTSNTNDKISSED